MSFDRPLVDVVREVCEEENIKVEYFSSNWVMRLTRSSSPTPLYIYGNFFGLNPTSSTMVCQDKNATYLCLMASGIDVIPHELFLNPGDGLVASYLGSNGSIRKILDYSEHVCGGKVVLKPLKGTGGIDVIKAFNPREVEAAILHLFRKDYGLVVSPYKSIVREVRTIVLDGSVKLMYQKNRIGVYGDGISTVNELVYSHMRHHNLDSKILRDFQATNRNEVLEKSEFLPIEWRHNLGHGATVEKIDSCPVISKIALETAIALGMRFCSVDIVQIQDESNLHVLEVNAGVMMDAFASISNENRLIAKAIYREAILLGLV